MTIPILFPGGAYGTYLEWCLSSLCSPYQISSPFRDNGNSHNYIGVHLPDMQGWRQHLKEKDSVNFVRLHPKNAQDQSIKNHLIEILQSVDKVIFLYPDADSVLLNINNCFYKTWNDWWSHIWKNHAKFRVDPIELYKNWPIPQGTKIQNIDKWIRREFLSIYLFPAWQSQVEWYFPDHWQSPRCRYVFIKNLLHDFENTITDVVNFLQLDIQQPISELLPYHEENMKLQKYLDQDRICNLIVDSISSNNCITWNNLPVISEAWIQWRLRELGYEIRCHELDIFPTTSVQLKELLYTP